MWCLLVSRTIMRVATLWDVTGREPGMTLFHSTGETSQPYRRSRILLASWADESGRSSSRHSSTARWMVVRG